MSLDLTAFLQVGKHFPYIFKNLCCDLNENGAHRLIFYFLVSREWNYLKGIRKYGHLGRSVSLGMGSVVSSQVEHLSLPAACRSGYRTFSYSAA